MLELISQKSGSFWIESSTEVGRLVISLVVLSVGVFFGFRGPSNIPKLYYAPSSAQLTAWKSKDSKETCNISMRKFLESKCPSLHLPYVPAWWLNSGHLQTIYCVLGDFARCDFVVYHRKLLRLLDGGTIGLDFTPADDEGLKPDTPVLVVLHGLTGGSHESYVRAILSLACAPKDESGLGYRAVVINFRGCAGTPITSPRLYSGAHTDDLRQVLYYLCQKFPKAPLLGIGYSLGANVLTRYLAEEGENSRLMSGCMLDCPWDLKDNNERLKSSFIGRHVYSKGMGANLQKVLKRHEKSFVNFPESLMAKRVIASLALNNPRLDEFDECLTRWVGGTFPPFPFHSVEEYYEYGSSHRGLSDIRVPFLTMNAEDDPVVRKAPIDVGGNGLGAMVMTAGGGHLGWFEVGDEVGVVRRWIKKPVLEWLHAVVEDLVWEAERGLPLHVVDGFLKEVGRDDLGCKEVEDTGFVVSTDGEESLLSGL